MPRKDLEGRREYANSSPYRENRARRLAERRQDPALRAEHIVSDSRKYDRKLGLQNDLTVEFARHSIAGGCAYCGETSIQMTLDRIDNTIGHMKTNVVPACVRCNLIRRDMPYAAWYAVMPSIRFARENGLFGSWTGKIHKK